MISFYKFYINWKSFNYIFDEDDDLIFKIFEVPQKLIKILSQKIKIEYVIGL